MIVIRKKLYETRTFHWALKLVKYILMHIHSEVSSKARISLNWILPKKRKKEII